MAAGQGLVALVCLALVWAVEGSDDVLVPDVARVQSVDMAVGGGNDAGSGGGAALAGVATHSQYVTVTNCGDIRANGRYDASPPNAAGYATYHRRSEEWAGEYRIEYLPNFRHVVDHDGAEHELPGRGQWLLSYVPGAGKRKRMLYAVAGEWYLPPPFGWAKMRGRKPEPELEYDVQPHPCDRIGLQLSRCGDHVNQPYCIKKAKRALLKCLDTYWSDSQRPPMLEGIYARIDGDLKPWLKPQPKWVKQGSADGSGWTSHLRCHEATVYPYRSPSRWCTCHNCVWRDGQVVLLQPKSELEAPTRLMSPLQSSYLHDHFETSDHVFATIQPGASAADVHCDRVVEEPAFVFAAHWLHNLYHLLVDAMLPVHNTMLHEYGEMRRDSYVWIQHEGRRQDILVPGGSHEDLQAEVDEAKQRDLPLRLLRALSQRPVRSRRDLNALNGTTCFRNLHLGVNMTESFFFHGVTASPRTSAVINPSSPLVAHAVTDHQAFARFLLTTLEADDREYLQASAGALEETALVVDRTLAGARRMSNLNDVVETVSEVVDTTVVRLETMSLTQQLAAFMNATIVVATHGQALAHAMFMPYNSVLVLLMEPGGYGWKWMYSNLALFSRVHVVVVRNPRGCIDTEGWGGIADHTQMNLDAEAFSVDLDLLSDAIEGALEARASMGRPTFRTVPDICQEDAEQASKLWYCAAKE